MNGGARFLTTWLNNSIEIESKILTLKGSYIVRSWPLRFFCCASFSVVLSLYYLCAKCVSKCPSPAGNSGVAWRPDQLTSITLATEAGLNHSEELAFKIAIAMSGETTSDGFTRLCEQILNDFDCAPSAISSFHQMTKKNKRFS